MSTQLAQRADELYTWFDSREDRLARVAADTFPPERAIQMLLELATQNPLVLECSKLTLWRCVQVSLELALPISGANGQLWVLPFQNTKLSRQKGVKVMEATPVIGYMGYVTLLGRQDIMVKTVLHYEGDTWDYHEGYNNPKAQSVIHKPDTEMRARIIAELGDQATPSRVEDAMNARMKHAYSIAHTPTGQSTFKLMDRAQLQSARQQSPGIHNNSSPWNDPLTLPAMWSKTVLRRHATQLKLGDNVAAQRAADIDAHFDRGGIVDNIPGLMGDDEDVADAE
jgi:recombinational DNA repair protein RecT